MSRHLFRPASSEDQTLQQKYELLARSKLSLIIEDWKLQGDPKPSFMVLSDFRRRLWKVVGDFKSALKKPSWKHRNADEIDLYLRTLEKFGVISDLGTSEISTKTIECFPEQGQSKSEEIELYDDWKLYCAVLTFINDVTKKGKEEETYNKPFGKHVKALKEVLDGYKTAEMQSQLCRIPKDLYARLADLDTLGIQLECKKRVTALEYIVAEVEVAITQLIEHYSEDQALIKMLAEAIKQREDFKVASGKGENHSNRETQRTLEGLVGSMGAHIEAATVETNAVDYDLDVFTRLIKLRDELAVNKQAQEYLYEQLAAEQKKVHVAVGDVQQQLANQKDKHEQQLKIVHQEFDDSKKGWMKIAQGLGLEIEELKKQNQALRAEIQEQKLVMNQQAERIRAQDAVMLAQSFEIKKLKKENARLLSSNGLPRPNQAVFDSVELDDMSISCSSPPRDGSRRSFSSGSEEFELVTLDFEELPWKDDAEEGASLQGTPEKQTPSPQLKRGDSDGVGARRDKVSTSILIQHRTRRRLMYDDEHKRSMSVGNSPDPHKPKTPPQAPSSKLSTDGGHGSSEESYDGGTSLLG